MIRRCQNSPLSIRHLKKTKISSTRCSTWRSQKSQETRQRQAWIVFTLQSYLNLNLFQNGRESRRDTMQSTRFSQQEDPTDSPHPFLNQRRSVQSDNTINLSDIPPAPPRPCLPKLTPAQMRLRRAVHVDKFSRVGFPLTFAILNCTYWYMFYEYI